MESTDITIAAIPLSKNNLKQILIALHLQSDEKAASNLDPQLTIELTKKFRRVTKLHSEGEKQ